MSGSVRIVRGTLADVGRLGALWLAMHRAHREAMPEMSYSDDEMSWAERRAQYERLMGDEDSRLMLALDDEELVGYGLSRVEDAVGNWRDTWRTGDRVAEVESLSVAPDHRGRGIGGALLDRLEAENAALGVRDLVIGVLAGNTDAARLYQRRGFRPTMVYLSRFAERD